MNTTTQTQVEITYMDDKFYINGEEALPWRTDAEESGSHYGIEGEKYYNPDRTIFLKVGSPRGQRAKEISYWCEASLERRKYLAPILDHGLIETDNWSLTWVAMEYIHGMHGKQVRQQDEKLFDVLEREIYQALPDVYDMHPDNWIVRENGRPVVVDYGMSGS